jgi:alpha/beta superfamily hydrolase
MYLFRLLLSIPLTDILLIVGLVLSLLLMTLLWLRRHRHPTGIDRATSEQKTTKSKRNLWGFGFYFLKLVAFAILSFIFIGGGVLIYKDYQEINEEIAPSPSVVEIPGDLPFEVEEVTFTGGDGIKLAGWYIPPSNGATIILLHGYSSNRTSMLWHATNLVEAGYGVLMYDERGSGESEGEYRSYGWQDAPDVGVAIEYLTERSEADSNLIGILGCSIGGQIALQGAAYYPEIKAVWADGASGIMACDSPPPNNWATSIAFLSEYILDWMLIQRLDIQPPQPMIEIIGKIAPRPLMLVAGGFPHPYFGNEARRVLHMASYAGSGADVWIIPEAYHCDRPIQRPDEYAHRMEDFFDKAFGVR